MTIKSRATFAAALAIFCPMLPTFSQQPANDHLLSSANLSRLAAHTWMVKGFPNIGIVVGDRATLVIDTGLGPKKREDSGWHRS